MNRKFTRRTFLKTAGAMAAGLGTARFLHAGQMWGPTWNSLTKHTTPTWFQDAKFGIYFHWGVYSVPAFDNEWYSRNMYIAGSRANKFHNLVYGSPSKFGYKDFIPMFHAEKFNADEWAQLFRRAGAKFAGPVAEHADGFSMWNSTVNPWNAVRMGPRRDVVGELGRAIRNAGMKFIATLHHQWLWGWYPTSDKAVDCSNPKYAGLYGPPAPGSPFDYSKSWSTLAPPTQAFQDRWEAKVREVIDGYQPSLIYFDSRLNIIDARHLAGVISYYYNQAERWHEEVSVTYKNKDLPWGTGIYDIERGRLGNLAPYNWLTDDAIDWNSWCYVQNPDFKCAARIVHELVDIVSKNGNLVLDITPTAWGVIPEPVVGHLLAIGQWLALNGEAVYGTRPWKIYGEGPTRIKSGSFGETMTPNFVAQDIRFTSRGKTLYATALGWPQNTSELVIKSLATSGVLLSTGEIANVSMLGSGAKLSWQHKPEGLRITLPQERPCNFAYVFKLSLT
jgi:alpha-L-fucosidase